MRDERALVVGYGRMGHFHERVLRDLGYQVTTVDPDPDTGADHLTIAEALVQHDWRSQDQYEVAAVATPIQYLADAAFQLAGTPKLLVEKPFAPTVKEARMLAAYLEKSGSDVCVGYVERFNPQIRQLRGTPLKTAHFTRHNDRPSPDIYLDLLTHDVDLAGYLCVSGEVTFDIRDNQPERVRSISVVTTDGAEFTVDLTDHAQSPLHALWHAFLTGKPVPAPVHAIGALEYATLYQERDLLAAA